MEDRAENKFPIISYRSNAIVSVNNILSLIDKILPKRSIEGRQIKILNISNISFIDKVLGLGLVLIDSSGAISVIDGSNQLHHLNSKLPFAHYSFESSNFKVNGTLSLVYSSFNIANTNDNYFGKLEISKELGVRNIFRKQSDSLNSCIQELNESTILTSGFKENIIKFWTIKPSSEFSSVNGECSLIKEVRLDDREGFGVYSFMFIDKDIIITNNGESVKFWNIAGEMIHLMKYFYVRSFSVCSNKNLLLINATLEESTSQYAKSLFIVNMTGKEIIKVIETDKYINSFFMTEDENHIFIINDDLSIDIYDTLIFNRLARYSGHSAKIIAMHYDTNSGIVYSSDKDSIHMWH